MTSRLPNVVTTMQTDIRTAIKTVSTMPKGAGQQEGPQSWIVTPSPSCCPAPVTMASVMFWQRCEPSESSDPLPRPRI